MIGGLLLALASAALINIGFLLQHRGLARAGDATGPARLRRALRDRVWLAGQAVGWIGFGAQIVAVAIAPLSLVQAFAAGGLALSVPIAAGIFNHRITARQALAVLIIAAGLAALPIGFSSARDRLGSGELTVTILVAAAAAAAIWRARAPGARAIAAGIFYGVADAAIKAISLRWNAHGLAALVSGWTLVAGLGTFLGFLSFQSALQEDGAVAPISLMNGLAALVALACGLLAFGESLGTTPVATVAHATAIAIVLGAVPVLAAAHAALVDTVEPPAPDRAAPPRALRSVAERAR